MPVHAHDNVVFQVCYGGLWKILSYGSNRYFKDGNTLWR